LIVMLGMSLGPIIAGLMADASGNYESGFTVLAAAAFLGGFCFLFAKPPERS
jgi:MFS family permease